MSRISRREMRDLALSWHILKFPVIFPVRSPDLPRVFPGSCREKNRDLNKISGIRRTGLCFRNVCNFLLVFFLTFFLHFSPFLWLSLTRDRAIGFIMTF